MNRDDNVFLSEGGIMVSQARIVNQVGAIAMSGVNICLAREERHKGLFWLKIGAIFVSLNMALVVGAIGEAIGIGAGMGGIAANIIGLAIAIAGVVASIRFIKAKRYAVWLGTNSGDVRVAVSQDREFILRVQLAVNQAIEMRG